MREPVVHRMRRRQGPALTTGSGVETQKGRNCYSFFPSDLPSAALRRSSSNKLKGVSGEVLGTVLRRAFLVDGGEAGCEEGGV